MIRRELKKLANKYLREGKKDNSKKYYQIATKNIINDLQKKAKEKLAVISKTKPREEIKSEDFSLTEQEEIAVLKNLRKKSLESIKAYTDGNRLELAEKEKIDLKIIEEFLPKELSEEETKKLVDDIFQKLKDANKGAVTIGSVMKELKIHSNMNMGLASQLVRERLMNNNKG